MAVTITSHIDLGGFNAVLKAYQTAAEDLTPLMDQLGQLLETSAGDRIRDTNQAPDGTAWPQSFRAQEVGGKTLHDSGRLAASLQHVADRRKTEVGTNLIYAGIHQVGGDIVPKAGKALAFGLPDGGFAVVGKVTIPARPYLGISTEDATEITALAVDYFEEVVPQ